MLNLHKVIADLREELERIDQAIAALERLASGQGVRRGRPPTWLLKSKAERATGKHVVQPTSNSGDGDEDAPTNCKMVNS